MPPIDLDYLTPQPKKTTVLPRLALLCAISPFCICCPIEFLLFSDETPFTTFQQTAFTLSLFAGPVAAITLGLLALRQIKQNPNLRGSGLASSAILIGTLWLLLFLSSLIASLIRR